MSIAALCVFSVQFEYQLSGPFERRLANSAVQTQSGTVTASTGYFRHIVAAVFLVQCTGEEGLDLI